MHVDFSDIKIQDFYVHRVGNKANDEALVLAAGAADADEEVKAALLQTKSYFDYCNMHNQCKINNFCC